MAFATLASLRSELRLRISDVAATLEAFRLRCTDPAAKTVRLTITATMLTTTVTGGSAAGLSITLTGKTVRQVVDEIQAVALYSVSLSPAASAEHSATDFRLTPATGVSIGNADYTVQTHAFSDTELDTVLENAAKTHSPSFTASTVPEKESGLVLLLAHILVCHIMAHDNSRFYPIAGVIGDADKGSRVKRYLDVARALREEYDTQVERLGIKPTDDEDGDDETGVIEVGTLRRNNLRIGARVPLYANTKPRAVTGLAVSKTAGPVEDPSTELFLSWDRTREPNFSRIVVLRQTDGSDKLLDVLDVALRNYNGDADFLVRTTIYNSATNYFHDTGLEAATEYNYRVYTVDRNGEATPSASAVTETTDA